MLSLWANWLQLNSQLNSWSVSFGLSCTTSHQDPFTHLLALVFSGGLAKVRSYYDRRILGIPAQRLFFNNLSLSSRTYERESQMQSFCPQRHPVTLSLMSDKKKSSAGSIVPWSPPPFEAKGTDRECRSAFPLPEKTIKAEDKTFAKVPFANSWFNIFIGHCMNNWEKVLKLFSSSYLI